MTQNLLVKKIRTYGEIAEIKRIYAVVEASLLKKNSACLVLTSGIKGEGKTTVAAGIAVMAAHQNDKKVLAMDLNWYTPGLHHCFDLDFSIDAESMQRVRSVDELVQATQLEGLDILAAAKSSNGVGNGIEGVNALAAELIDKAREQYNFIVVDTCPMFPPNRRMIDPAFVAKKADGVALVTLTNATPREYIKRATKALESVNANIIGVVVNQWKNPIASA